MTGCIRGICMKKKALIAMSGGVDSSAAAYLTQQAGYEPIGCMMRLHDRGSSKDVADAQSIADKLGMRLYVLDCRAEFASRVVEPFVQSYLAGQTPNPCIACNRHMKFGRLLREADALGCEKLVTGHYARVEETAEGFLLKTAADPQKDQSYVLYMLTQAQLARLFLPLGNLTKAQARAIAEAQGFVSAERRESQDICFVPDGDYAGVIEAYTGKKAQEGDFVDASGRVLGRHRGIIRYTVGQHRGLGISLGKVQYVCGIDAKQNRVILGDKEQLFSHTVTVCGVSWVRGVQPPEGTRCEVKLRYRHTAQPASVHFCGEDTVRMLFDAPQRAVTAGQTAVFYDGDTVLGGGTILGI